MKFECKECLEPCVLDTGDSAYVPETCPIGYEEVNWRPLPEPAALPKLTAEALAERGIEWPEWATCAIVSRSSSSYFCESKPEAVNDGIWFGDGRVCGIPGKWDASDWPHSKIMRPSKVEQLPDWLKLGAWAAVGNFVGKVDWLSRDGSECRITCGESRFAKTAEVKAVTFRAWTFEEAPEAVKCTVSGILRIARLALLANSGHPIHGYELPGVTCFASFGWMRTGATQLNGLPCGVPQVDGKDLEG